MSASAEANIRMTDQETLVFSWVATNRDGSPFVYSDYAYEYGLNGQGVSLLLTDGDGITVDTSFITIKPTDASFRLAPGTYSHGLTLTHNATGEEIQPFDGSVIVSKGY